MSLRSVSSDGRFEPQFAVLNDLVFRSSEALSLNLLSTNKFMDDAVASGPMPVPVRSAEDLLSEMVALLEQSNMRAIEIFEQYMQQHHNRNDVLNPSVDSVAGAICRATDGALAKLDFKAALDLIRQLQASHR